MKFFKKSYTYAACFGLLLTSSFSLLDAQDLCLIRCHPNRKSYDYGHQGSQKSSCIGYNADTSYSDDNIQVNLTEKTVENTQVYIADITVSSSDYLKTAFAQNTYGTNVTAKTSVTAANNSAILAVNGDYYGG